MRGFGPVFGWRDWQLQRHVCGQYHAQLPTDGSVLTLCDPPVVHSADETRVVQTKASIGCLWEW